MYFMLHLKDVLQLMLTLDLYYSTKVYEQMTDQKYGLQLMSDDYILEELIQELRETQ